ncbi:MAG TPA: 16S rRNA (cytidine(1402)-2'-O)-methyltransferase [Dehalococcoidia bacterium]|nr:16S rRNA (cytidine(1402)-2'-O)-methyltransferase [Dehalococcoidia bacterium]
MGILYVAATPIGNLEDVTLRALRVLATVPLVAAEDTRTAGVFLRHHGLNPKLISYNDHNMTERIPQILQRLADGDVALVSDAGTPAISDPGVDLVAAAREAGYEVVALPGVSAPVTAVSVAGLRSTSFHFVGFLPRSEGALRRLIEAAAASEDTLVAFESPQRLRKTLAIIEEVAPSRRIAVCRELTKLHEETFVGTAAEALAHFTQPRGEIVLLLEAATETHAINEADEASLREEVVEMKRLGLTRAQATALLTSRHGTPRRRAYQLWLEKDPR